MPLGAPTVDTTQPINAEGLGKQAPTLPPPVQSTTAQTKLAAAVGGLADGVFTSHQTEAAAAQAAPAPAKNTGLQDALAGILSLGKQVAGKSGRAYEIQEDEGVFSKKAKSKQLENEIISKTRAYDKQIEKIRQNAGGGYGQSVDVDVQRTERLKNSELADLAIQYKVANDDYTGAFEIAQAKVDAEFEPLQAQIDTLKTYYQLAQNDMTESEKVEAQAAIQEKEATLQFERDKELYKYKQQIDQSDPLYRANLANVYSQIAERNKPESDLTADQEKAQTATQNMIGLLNQYKGLIKNSSFLDRYTNPETRAKLQSLKGQITAEYKTAKQLGTLDAGVQKLVDTVVPDAVGLGITSLSKDAQVAAIDNFLANQGDATADDSSYEAYLKALGQ
jgi:hypothetical protein